MSLYARRCTIKITRPRLPGKTQSGEAATKEREEKGGTEEQRNTIELPARTAIIM